MGLPLPLVLGHCILDVLATGTLSCEGGSVTLGNHVLTILGITVQMIRGSYLRLKVGHARLLCRLR